ncbi:MAG: AMP-binding protein [Flavobacteriaceae bacterium]|nr:AMP-binding protein [Flavobacteriaceae bacterium]
MIRTWLTYRSSNRFKLPRDIARFAFKKHTKKKAIIHGNITLLYKDLARRVFCLANGFNAIGLSKDDVILTLLPYGMNQIEINLACFESGTVLSALSTDIDKKELLEFVNKVQPKLFIYDSSVSQHIAVLLKLEIPKLKLLEIGTSYEWFLNEYPDERNSSTINKNDTASIKLALQKQPIPYCNDTYIKNIQIANQNKKNGLQNKNITTFLCGIPITCEENTLIFCNMLSGNTIIIPEEYTPNYLLKLVEKHNVNCLYVSSELLSSIAESDKLESYNFKSLVSIIYNSEKLTEAQLTKTEKLFGPIIQHRDALFKLGTSEINC